MPAEELANESRSTHITVAADMVFSLSHYLSGVSVFWTYVNLQLMMLEDCYRGLRASSQRCVLGRDSIIRAL